MSSTLESLSIEITASSQGASEAIESLANSLGLLKEKVAETIPGLRELRNCFRKLTQYSNMKLPLVGNSVGRTISSTTSSVKKQTEAIKEQAEAMIEGWEEKLDKLKKAIRDAVAEGVEEGKKAAEGAGGGFSI